MKIRFVFFLSLLAGLTFSAAAQSEEEAIKKTVLNYLEGGTQGDVARFKSAFVADAVQRSVGSNGAVTGMSVDNLASKITPGKVMDRTTSIVSWSYANNAATAVTETIYPSSKIIDLLNLLKVNGEWKIVSRVFSRMELSERVASSSPGVSAPAGKPGAAAAKQPAAAPAKKKPVADDGW